MSYFKDPDEILALYRSLQMMRAPLIQEMIEIRDVYNSDVNMPLPELDKNEKPAVPNLAELGIDQMAMRVASTPPDVRYPELKPNQPRSMERARQRRLATLGWWEENRIPLVMHRRARHLITYACSPVMIRPSFKMGIPQWYVRDPLTTYPAPTIDPTDCRPPQVVFAYTRTWHWLRTYYPQQAAEIERPDPVNDTDKFEILEYVDDVEITLLAVSTRQEGGTPSQLGRGYSDGRNKVVNGGSGGGRVQGYAKVVLLEQLENRTGQCTVVIPERITLDRPKGQYTGMVGKYMMQSKLFTLQYFAALEEVFPDEWAVSANPGQEAVITKMADGRQGIIGKVVGGKIERTTQNIGMAASEARDYLERAERLTAGIPPDLGGESGSNIRTGRRGDQILSAAIDYTIQAAQLLFQQSLQEENCCAIAVAKAYFGSQPKSYFVEWDGTNAQVDYVPNEIFETTRNIVKYPFAGVDANSLIIGVGQRLGIGEMSLRSAMEIDPMIRDPEIEQDRIAAEGMRRALMQAVEQGIANNQYGPAEVAQMALAVIENKLSPEAAILKIQEQQQAKQASSGPPGTPEGPVPPGSPEAQPGLGPPGQAGATVPPPDQSTMNFADQLGALFPAQRQLQRNKAAAAAQGG